MIDQDGHNLAFILGLPRSGTTLLSVILDKHPRVMCPPEPWIMLALESVGKTCIRHPADSRLIGQAVSEFSDAEANVAAARAFATTVYNRRLDGAAGKSVFVDKTPRYYHILPFVRQTFREAKWIWLQRNPLDVAASYKGSWKINLAEVLKGNNEYPAWSFDIVVGLDRLCREVDFSDPRVLAIQYEQLVTDAENCTARVMRFLGLEPAADQTQFDLANSSFAKSFAGDKKITETGKPHAQSIGAWKSAFNKDELQVLLDFIGVETMRQLGYGAAVNELKAMGVNDSGPHVTAERRGRVLQIYADRLADVQAAARVDVPMPWTQRIDAELAERKAAIEKLTGELTQSRTREQQLGSDIKTFMELSKDTAADLERANASLAEATTRSDAREQEIEAENRKKQIEIADLTRNAADYKFRYEELRAKAPLPVKAYRWVSGIAQRAIVGWPHGRRRTHRPLPSLTVVTPVFNGEAHIREAIESVLSQNYPQLQYIVVDGGSTDGTMGIVNEYKDRISHMISEKDNGMYDAIAKGWQLATGQVLGYLNCDDLYEAGGLMRVGEYFRDHPRTAAVYHEDTVLFDGWRFPNAAQPPRLDRLAILKGHILFQDGVFFKRSVYQSAGGLNRAMRRAGDWDLWVRLMGKVRFRRGEAHQSTFRVVPGQLSADMAAYNAEVQHVRGEWYKKLGQGGSLPMKACNAWHRVQNLFWRKLTNRRLFFSLPASGCVNGGRPSPGRAAPAFLADQPRCPLTGVPPDRLLFSSRDTRFGDELINQMYYCSESDMAVTYPPLSKEQLNDLYERHYSNPDAKMIPAREGFVSPYINYRGGGYFDRWIAKQVLPRVACRGVRWDDQTCEQLIGNVPGLSREGGQIKFLDVGCFDGKLLNAITKVTDWKTYGLEPNSKAAELARREGHQVWQGFAEDATFVVPQDMSFDVIHLGQTIEHLGDPLTVVRRLRGLLKPGGRMVLSTPNLNSKQIDLFGPTWSHWHPPYHRFLFSPKSLKMMAKLADMELVRTRSYSHPYWTCMSVQLNKMGVGAAVPHTVNFSDEVVNEALSLTFWSKWLWDWRGRGDYLVTVFRKR